MYYQILWSIGAYQQHGFIKKNIKTGYTMYNFLM